MNREKILIKNVGIYFIGNFGSKFLSFFLLPFYTFYLTTSDYGYFDLITTTIMLLIPFISFQIQEGLYRYLLETEDDREKSVVISNSVIIVFKNLIISNLIYIVVTLLFDFKYKYLILLQLDTSIIAGMWMQIVRGLKQNGQYAIAGIILTLGTLISNVIMIALFRFQVDGLIISNIIAAMLVIIYLEKLINIRKHIHFKANNKVFLKEITAYSLPLIPTALSWWFMNVSDRYILNYFKGMEANGIYAVANKFPSIIILVNSIFYLAWQESAILERNSHDRDCFYTRMFNNFLVVEFTSIIVLLAFTKFFMSFMVNSKFDTAWQYIPFLYMGAVFSAFANFYGIGYQNSKETKGLFSTAVIGALLNIVINILIVPSLGIQGASLSTMLAFLFVWVSRVIQTRKYFKIWIDKPKLYFFIIISVLAIWAYFNGYPYIQPLLMLLSIVIFIVLNWKLISEGVNFARYKLVRSR